MDEMVALKGSLLKEIAMRVDKIVNAAREKKLQDARRSITTVIDDLVNHTPEQQLETPVCNMVIQSLRMAENILCQVVTIADADFAEGVSLADCVDSVTHKLVRKMEVANV